MPYFYGCPLGNETNQGRRRTEQATMTRNARNLGNERRTLPEPSIQSSPASQPALTSKTMIIIINDNSDRGGCFCTAERKIQMRMILRMTLQVSVINIYICRRPGICQELIKILSNCPIILFNPFLSFPVPSRSHPVAVLAHLGPVIYEVKLRVSFDVAKL